jgi:hypothetical protein
MDLTGIIFHNLKVIRKHPFKGHNSQWECECLLCGKTTIVPRPNLKSGNTKDCGCEKSKKLSLAHTKHGDSHAKGTRGHEIYKKWQQMLARCKDKNKPYLRKGITVCQEWHDYETFKKWADCDLFNSALELDRINNDAGYSPDNCRWVTHAENCRNKTHPLSIRVKNSKGEIFSSAAAASKAYGLEKNAVAKALKTGYKCAQLRWEAFSEH